MKYVFKNLLGMVLCLSLSGCAYENSHLNLQKDVFPRTSFLKVAKSMKITVCKDDTKTQQTKCRDKNLRSSGSASIVKTTPAGAFALTAAHVCDDSRVVSSIQKEVPEAKISTVFNVITIDGDVLPALVIDMDKKNDICMLWIKNLFMPPLLVSDRAPEPGDRVYNVAAPLGVHSINMIPLFEGFYNGIDDWDRAMYSIPAFGGSSGSPIVNTRGELVGMIHSTLRFFPQIVVSPNYKAMRTFINDSIEKDAYSRLVNVFLNVFYR